MKDDVLLIASRPERSGGVHKGVFIQLPRGQLPQGSLLWSLQAGCAGWLHACTPKSSLLRSQSAVAVSVSPVSGSCTLVQLYYSHNMKFPANLVYPVLEGHDSINVARIESSAISARMHSSQHSPSIGGIAHRSMLEIVVRRNV